MSAETDLHDALNAGAALTALVADRIYPDFLAQEIVIPAVVYQRAETEYVTTIHDGLKHGTTVVVEIWCLAGTRIGAEMIANAAETAIAGAFLPLDRRPEFNEERLVFSTVITCSIFQPA